MASVDDIRVLTAWRTHPKRMKLQRKLGHAGVIAIMDLWMWAGENRPHGILTGMDIDDIEIAAQWAGDAGAFVSAAVALRLIDKDDAGAFRLHDWSDHQAWADGAVARSESARTAARAKWKKRNGQHSEHAPASEIECDRSATAVRPHDKTDAGAMPLSFPLLSSPSPKDPPLSPVGGTAVAFGFDPPPVPTARATRAEKKAATLAARKVDAQTVLTALNAARLDVIPNSSPLRPTDENLTHIADRLEAGATVDECLHVVAVRAEEVRGGGESKWFDAVTPFLADSFARSLAQPPPIRPPKSNRMNGAESDAALLAKSEAECARWRAEGLIP